MTHGDTHINTLFTIQMPAGKRKPPSDIFFPEADFDGQPRNSTKTTKKKLFIKTRKNQIRFKFKGHSTNSTIEERSKNKYNTS